MRCNPWRWLWGLIPIAMLSWVAVLGQHESIENDLAQRVKSVLARQGFTWATVKFTGREGVLGGQALAEGEPDKALQAALDTWGVRSMTSNAGLVAKVDKYHWKALRDGNRLRLEGHVPSDNARRDIVAAARAAFQGAQVDDKMTLARGAPGYEPWLGGISFGLKQLALLPKGQLDLEQLDLSVRGEAADSKAYEAVKTALASAMPKGVRLKQEGVTPPIVKPYVWSARHGAGQLQIAGSVPGDAARKEIRAAAQRSLPRARLADGTTFGGGAPNGFAAAVAALLTELGHLDEGTAELRDTAVVVKGVAESPAKADAVRAALKRMAGFTVRDDITVRPITPYVTSARIDGGSVVLAGHAPSEAARRTIIDAVRRELAGKQIRDELQIGAGEAPTWANCLGIGLSSLRQLGNGRVVLTDRRLEVAGMAATEREMQQLAEAIRDRAANDCVAQSRLTWDVARAEAEARARTEAEARDRQAAEEARRRAEEERARAAQPAPAAAGAEDARRREEAGARQRADGEARARAEAAAREAERARNEAAARQRAEPQERQRVETEVRRQQAQSCQETMRSAAREGVILFRYAKADIDATSFATLDRVAEAANRCPGFKIEVSGHTDTDGAPDRNQRLSERRARAVLQYLVKAGVDADRLTAIGYGETRPEAPNDTAENKARNRRIEFSVAGN